MKRIPTKVRTKNGSPGDWLDLIGRLGTDEASGAVNLRLFARNELSRIEMVVRAVAASASL
jgi:hypothetical protein